MILIIGFNSAQYCHWRCPWAWLRHVSWCFILHMYMHT